MGRFADLYDTLCERTEKQDPTNLETWIKSELNRAAIVHTNINYKWQSLLTKFTLSTTANTDEYPLPFISGKIKDVYHLADGVYKPITAQNTSTFHTSWLSSSETDIPRIYMFDESGGMKVITNTLTDGYSGKVQVFSDSNSDVSQTVRVYGVSLSTGEPIAESVSLSGTARTKTTSSEFSYLLRETLSATCVGNVTLASNLLLSGGSYYGDVLAVIPRSHTSRTPFYKRIKFWPIPDSTYTIYFTVHLKQHNMVDDNDCTLLPEEHDNAILLLAQYFMSQDPNLKKLYNEAKQELIRSENSETLDANYRRSAILNPLGSGSIYAGTPYFTGNITKSS